MSVRAESYHALREIKRALAAHEGKNVLLTLHEATFNFIAGVEFDSILALEQEFKCQITLASDVTLKKSDFRLESKK